MAPVLKPKNIIFLGAGFTTNNMGVWALASGAIRVALNENPGGSVSLLDYSYNPARYIVEHKGRKAIVQLINIRFSKKIWLPNNIARLLVISLIVRALPFSNLRNEIIRNNYWINHICQADLIGSIAGGDSFSDIYGLRRLIYVALPQILVLFLGKPLYLLPQTIGPFKTGFGKRVARFILKRCQQVYCRDLDSIDTIRRLLPYDGHRMSFCFDMGFVLEPKISEESVPSWLSRLEADTPLIGINVSGLLYIGGYTRNNMFGLKADYRDVINALIVKIAKTSTAHVMLVPHVLGTSDNQESDIVACKKVFSQVEEELRDQIHIIDQNYDHHETKAIIGRCHFFLGSRMHACIAALSQSIPAVALAYSKKFIGVYRSMLLEDLVVDLRYYDADVVVQKCIQLYEKRKQISKELQGRIPGVMENVFGLFSKQ